MNTKKTNRSVLRTQKLLKEAFIELLYEKPIQQISVKELTDRVDLNRGTFYLHYTDIYHLLETIENELFAQFQEIVHAHDDERMNGHPFPLLEDIFLFLKEHQTFCQLMLSANGDANFVNKLKTFVKESCFSDWNKTFMDISQELCDIYYSYIVSGCVGLIEHWIVTGLKKSPEEMAALAESMILKGTSSLSLLDK